MKKIKKRNLALIVLGIILVVYSCTSGNSDCRINNNRIKIKVSFNPTTLRSTAYEIIEIDGVEYVSYGSGGICPLVIKD